jgi:hypothetical protein
MLYKSSLYVSAFYKIADVNGTPMIYLYFFNNPHECKHVPPHDAKRMLAGRTSVFSDIIELLLPIRQMLVQLSP